MRIITLSRGGIFLTLGIIALTVLGTIYHSLNSTLPSLVKDPRTYYMVNTQEKVVALTFDDGPDPLYTGAVLDILRDKEVKATFFILGKNASENPNLLQRISDEGHEIGNHGYSHSYTSSRFVQELIRTNEIVYQSTKKQTQFYRPPGGLISESVIAGVKEQGQILTLWSIDSKDWQNPGPARIIQNVVNKCFPGAIILLHDGGEKREQTIQALSKIIDQLTQQGYRFVTVSELRNFERSTPVQGIKPQE